jgi:hypothetical protein
VATVRSRRRSSTKPRSPNGYDPTVNGLLLANGDPALITNSNTVTAGTVTLVALPVDAAMTASKLWYGIGTAATAPTAAQCFVGLYGNRQGNTLNLLGKSADQSSNYGGGFVARSALLTAQGGQTLALPAGSKCYAAFLFNGTTSPQIYRVGANSYLADLNLATTDLRSFVVGTGLLDLPATVDLTAAAITSPYWAGVS